MSGHDEDESDLAQLAAQAQAAAQARSKDQEEAVLAAVGVTPTIITEGQVPRDQEILRIEHLKRDVQVPSPS